jgi:hypothetical protein
MKCNREYWAAAIFILKEPLSHRPKIEETTDYPSRQAATK